MKRFSMKKGFTLIELLVVIAIIGILASVVLASLNSARAKGAQAAVKGGMANMAAQIELYYDQNGTYGLANGGGAVTSCSGGAFSDTVVQQALIQIGKNSAASSGGQNSVICNTDATGQKWAMSTTMKGDGNPTWCVDNSGWRNSGTATGGQCIGGSSGSGSTGTQVDGGNTSNL